MREPRYFESDQERKRSTGGVCNLSVLLTVAFVVLKLCGVIDWSWWWVLAPTWIPIVLVAILVFVMLVLPNKD